jgi:hypothetical protein
MTIRSFSLPLPGAWKALPSLAAVVLLAACSSNPPAPEWQMNARSSLERFESAYLGGNAAIESVEFKRAHEQIASSGRIELIVRAELTRCAVRVASLVFEECAGYDQLRQDAAPAEQAYAAYLTGAPGRLSAAEVALLPAEHRAAASAASDTGAAQAVQAIADPLSRLIAAGVLMRAGRATPALLANAVDTASEQGWRRPLLAWLGVQAMRAEQAGDAPQAQRIRRRMDLVQGTDTAAGAPR